MTSSHVAPAHGGFFSYVLTFLGLFLAVDALLALGLATLSVALGTRLSPSIQLALFLVLPILFIAGLGLMRWAWPDEENSR